MNIGEKIKSARLAKGYTQEELGKLIGVQKSAVAKYEKGRVVNIKRSVLAKISQVLDIPPVELVSDIEEKPVETANKLADWYLGLEYKEDEDVDFLTMVDEYKQLDESKQAQVREYVHFLLGRN
ncbi:MAG: helix-turn-helix transcriptional regulator [Roseburia sp.]|nr:helix-turn-helix transcriptional regulator [Roseburia sp.]